MGETGKDNEMEKIVLLTKTKLWAVLLIQLSEAFQIMVLMPMVVFMVRDFGISSKNLGIYTSILNASFCGCQFITSYGWGWFSDKFGRRAALMIGQSMSTIAMLVFGFSTSYPQALIARCMTGFFNGNIGVMKAYLADITDSSNRSYAFSMIAISFGIGSVLGSMVGGLLIETTDVDLDDNQYIKTRSIFKFWIFETQFPFLPPFLVGVILSLNAFIMTLIYVKNEKLDEINEKYNANTDTIRAKAERSRSFIKKYDALSNADSLPNYEFENGTKYAKKYSRDDIDHQVLKILKKDNSIDNSNAIYGQLSLMEYQNMKELLYEKYSNKNTNDKPLLRVSMDKYDEYDPVINNVRDLLKKTHLPGCLLQYGLLAICFMMFKEMNPVYVVQALEFDSQFIGYIFAWSGFWLLTYTYFLQPKILKKYKHRKLSLISASLNIVSIAVIPSLIWVRDLPKLTLLIFCFISEFVNVCAAGTLFVIVFCYINNSIPPEHMGKANGLGQAIAAFVRGIGPLITGFLWSDLSYPYIDDYLWVSYISYAPMLFGFLFMLLHLYFNINDDMQLTWKERKIKYKNNNDSRNNSIKISMQPFNENSK